MTYNSMKRKTSYNVVREATGSRLVSLLINFEKKGKNRPSYNQGKRISTIYIFLILLVRCFGGCFVVG